MRNILIASLGAGNKERNYKKTNYKIDGKIYNDETYVASALEKHFNIDKTFYIGTLGSMWENIYSHYCDKFQKVKNEKYEEDIFYKMTEFIESSINEKQSYSLNFIDFNEFISTFDNRIVPIITTYGLNDKEIFENFNNILSIVEKLEDGDILYLDITHSFRANAFWMFLVMNYLNDVMDKKIKIEYISYGMYEAKEKNNLGIEITPVINLKVFFDLTKWMKGAYTFKNFGNSDLICSLIEDKNIKNKLNNFSNAVNINYISSLKESIKSLEKNYELINSIEGPARLIIPKVVSEFLNHFKNINEDHEMFLRLAEWHYKEKRYSLSYTNAQEAFISYAKINGLSNEIGVKKDLHDLDDKLFIKTKGLKRNLKYEYDRLFDKKTEDILKEFFERFEDCRKIRNNIAHSDKKRNNPDADIKSLEKVLNFLNDIFKQKYFLKICKEKLEFYSK